MSLQDKEFEKDDERFNTGRLLFGVTSDETYSLDDILNEFGGWSSKKEDDSSFPNNQIGEKADEPAESASQIVDFPEAASDEIASEAANEELLSVEEPVEEPVRAPSRFQFISLDLNSPQELPPDDTVLENGQPAVWSWTDRSEPVEPEIKIEAKTEESVKKTSRKQEMNRESNAKESSRNPVSVPAALKYYRNRSAFTRLRMLFVALISLATILLTISSLFSAQVFQELAAAKATPVVLLILTCLCALASADILIRGLQQLLTFRFGLELLQTLAFLFCVLDSVTSMNQGRMSYSAVACLGFFFAAWNDYLVCVGNIRTLRIAADNGKHYSVKVAKAAWNDIDCAYKAEDEIDDLVDLLEAPNGVSSAMRYYVPIAACVCFVVSIVCKVRAGVSLIQMLAACFVVSVPLGGFISYTRPFARISTRLSRAGAALCGWKAAKILGSELGVIITDSDLYPAGSVTLNGVKVFHDFRLEQMISYAATTISMSESGLKPLFLQLAEDQGAKILEVGSFRSYEGGGLGAEIRGDIVLVGSLGFMHLMGIRLPQGTNVRQAVYVAVNGIIAGVVAVNYNPNTPVISALSSVVHRRNLNLIGATKDFLISPAMLHAKFHISTVKSEFPPVKDRYRLSALTAEDAVDPAAILARNTLLPYAQALAGARSLRGSVTLSLVVSLFSGVFGMLLVFFLGLGGALETASALNLLLFSVIWMIPNLLITTWSNKF